MGVNLKLINFKFETEILKFALSFNKFVKQLHCMISRVKSWKCRAKKPKLFYYNETSAPLSLHIILHSQGSNAVYNMKLVS